MAALPKIVEEIVSEWNKMRKKVLADERMY
jgi:hypothetical protein